ncbi:MAG: cobalamin-dependent protein [Anderseniella sp.]|nr:cobalamin-dependent protein [Anderseniella sp.]
MSMREDNQGQTRSYSRRAVEHGVDTSSREILNRLVDDEILPQLAGAFAASHRAIAGGAKPMSYFGYPSGPITPADIEALYLAVLGRSAARPEQVLAEVNARGARYSEMLEGLLRPAANRLGDAWLNDECSFFDVTIGMSKLHQLLHLEAGKLPRARVGRADSLRTVLLAGAPGEQHLFGLGVVEQGFLAAGWRVIMMAGADWPEVCDELRNERCDVVGLSCAGDRLRPVIKSAIDNARLASSNRDIKVIVGGHLFLSDSSLVSLVGADAAASDSQSAVEIATRLLQIDDETRDTTCLTNNSLS